MKLVFLAGACVVFGNKTLIVQQASNARHPGLWGPPAGHVEPGESLVEAAQREIKEETNLDVLVSGLVASGVKLDSRKKASFYVIYYVSVKGKPEVEVKDELISDFRWITKDEIENDSYPLRNPILKKILLKGLSGEISPLETFEILH